MAIKIAGTTVIDDSRNIVAGIGTAGAPSLTFTGDPDTGIYSPGADQVAVATNGVGRLFVDASGNVAIAQTPSNAASFTRSFNISALDASIALRGSSGGTYTDQGIFFAVDGVNYSQIYNDGIGQLIFRTGSGLSERLRIDSTGLVGIGTSSPAYRLDVQGGDQRILNQGTNSILEIGNGTTTNQNALIDLVGDTTYTDYGLRIIRTDGGPNTSSEIQHRGTGSLLLTAVDAGTIAFNTSNTSRMTIGSDGIVQITSPSVSQAFTVNATNATFASAVFIPVTIRAAGTSCFYMYGVADNVNNLVIFNNGNIVNTNNSYGALSDIKLKENIVTASSQWDDIKALQVRKYNFKEETGQQTHTQIGLIAQELELVSPGLVTEAFDRDEEGNELETTTKSINYSVLYMKAVKALQEAMERIETLEQRLNDAGIN